MREFEGKDSYEEVSKGVGDEGSGKLSYVIGMDSPEILMPEILVWVVPT